MCIDCDVLTNLNKATAQFTVWIGKKTNDNLSESVMILAMDLHSNAFMEVQLKDFENLPHESKNLLSLVRMELNM